MTDSLQSKAYAFRRETTATYLRDLADARGVGRGIDMPATQLFMSPAGGIPAQDSLTAGTAQCVPYQLADDGTITELTKGAKSGGSNNYSIKVYNIASTAIGGDKLFMATRVWEKYIAHATGGVSCQDLIDLIKDPDCDICTALCEECDEFATEDGSCGGKECCTGNNCEYPEDAVTSLQVLDNEFGGGEWNQTGPSTYSSGIDFCTWDVPMQRVSDGATDIFAVNVNATRWRVDGPGSVYFIDTSVAITCEMQSINFDNPSSGDRSGTAFIVGGVPCPS